jgi:hypothetical protein
MGFYSKGAGKSQLAVQVNNLASPKEVEATRIVWKDALARLATLLSQGRHAANHKPRVPG